MRLIDADRVVATVTAINTRDDDTLGYADGLLDGIEVFAEALRNAPTVDAVPVVRCRECKWGRTVRECDEYVWCGKPYAPPWASHKADWFCADGKRKEDTEISGHKAEDRRDA